MLVIFRSSATETITMFQNVALQLIRLMGHSGRVPGALAAADVPKALQSLEASIDQLKAMAQQAPSPAEDEDDEDEDERDRTRPVDLATRAVPLLNLLRRAAAANAEVLWEAQ